MIVQTVAHAKKVKQRFESLWRNAKATDNLPAWLCYDNETKPQEGFPSKHALIPQRADITIFSMAYRGEAYSFPTSNTQSYYPTEEEWSECFRDWFEDRRIIKVMHNGNYDLNLAFYCLKILNMRPIWDTMIGCWKASEFIEKGLKARAVRYGRFQRATKTINMADLNELGEYAEQDVVATDEFFQMQYFGIVKRHKFIVALNEEGKLVQHENPLYTPPFKVEHEELSPFNTNWLKLVEFPMLRATMRAERRGFPFDMHQLRKIRRTINQELRKSLKTMYRMAGWAFNPGSSKDLERVFDELEIDNPFKTRKSQKMQFDAKALNKLKDSHAFVGALTNYKELLKMVSTYVGSKDAPVLDEAGGLADYVNAETGCIHSICGTVAAITGRGSSALPNLQNIPARKDKFAIRSCFVATPVVFHVLAPRYRRRFVLVDLDYGQLEIRIMALASQDKVLRKVLSDPEGDIHKHTAAEFGISRQIAKSLNFCLLYGGGPYAVAEYLTFQGGTPTDEHEARVYIEKHAQVYFGIINYRKSLLQEHQVNGRIRLFTGRTRTLPDVDWDNERSVHKAETTLSNNAIQGAGQDFLKASVIRSDWRCINPDAELLKRMQVSLEHKNYLKDKKRELEKYRKILRSAECNFRLQVHDEVIYTVIPSAAEECVKILAEIMSWRHYFPAIKRYTVPLVAEGGVGDNWKEAKSDEAKFQVSAGFADWEKYQ